MSDRYQLYYNNDKQQMSFQVLESLASNYSDFSISSVFDEFKCDVYVLLDNPLSNIIAIDWDNTFTAYPDFYNKLLVAYLDTGFKPMICTLRSSDKEDIHDICEVIQSKNIEICPTNGELKKFYIKQNKGFSVNLWIDDFFPGIARCESDLMSKNGIEI